MSVTTAFMPMQGQNQNLTASGTSQTATIGWGANQLRITVKAGGGDLCIYNYSSGNASAVRPATTADYCVVAGQSSVISKSMRHDTIAFVTDTGATAAFKVIPGEGM